MIAMLDGLGAPKSSCGQGFVRSQLDKRASAALNRAFSGVWVAYSLAATLLTTLETLPTLLCPPSHPILSSSPPFLALVASPTSEPTTALHDFSHPSCDVPNLRPGSQDCQRIGELAEPQLSTRRLPSHPNTQ
jgi:hypothetical protein